MAQGGTPPGMPPGNNPYGQSPGGFTPPPAGGGGYPGAPGYPPVGPGAPVPGAPFGIHPVLGVPYSEKQKVVAGILQLLPSFFLGLPGIGRFYIGHNSLGLTQLLCAVLVGWGLFFGSCGILFFMPLAFWLWGIIDGVLLMSNETRDSDGRMLR